MLKRLYTLFIIIAMAASSTVKAEDTVYPTLTTQGGTYELVTSEEQLEDGGIYLFADNSSSNLLFVSDYDIENKRFNTAIIPNGYVLEKPSSTISFQEVNREGSPYEFIFEKVTNGWYFKNTDEGYITTGITKDKTAGNVELLTDKSAKSSLFSLNHRTTPPEKVFHWNVHNRYGSGIESNFGLKNSSIYFVCTQSDTKTKYIFIYKKISTATSPVLSMSNVGYATLYYGTKDVTLPAGLTASTYTLKNTQDATYLTPSHTYNAGDKIPAGTAVVVKGNEGNYTLTLSERDEYLSKDASNLLNGFDDNTNLSSVENANNKYFYKLTLNSEGDPNSVGFYWGAAEGGAFETEAHKAYLALDKNLFPSTSSAKQVLKFISPEDAEATSIAEIKKRREADAIYDLSGKQASKSGKGIKIEKGKKYLMR